MLVEFVISEMCVSVSQTRCSRCFTLWSAGMRRRSARLWSDSGWCTSRSCSSCANVCRQSCRRRALIRSSMPAWSPLRAACASGVRRGACWVILQTTGSIYCVCLCAKSHVSVVSERFWWIEVCVSSKSRSWRPICWFRRLDSSLKSSTRKPNIKSHCRYRLQTSTPTARSGETLCVCMWLTVEDSSGYILTFNVVGLWCHICESFKINASFKWFSQQTRIRKSFFGNWTGWHVCHSHFNILIQYFKTYALHFKSQNIFWREIHAFI